MRVSAAPVDRRLTVYTMGLLGLGSLAVYGASSYDATLSGGTEASVLFRHLIRIATATVACIVAALVPYRFSCRLALYALPFTLGLLALTVISGIAEKAHGIPRWLPFFFDTTLQPVELVKFVLLMPSTEAWWFM